ncbi:MAG: hypothetical protein NTW26_12040, partial [bacterium]|nr:hypothetical protein [bacterium]
TVAFNHTTDSTASAHDITLSEVVTEGLIWSENVQNISGPAFTCDTSALPVVTFFWDEADTYYNAVSPVRFSFDVIIANTVAPNQVLPDTVHLEWTSWTIGTEQVSPYNPDAYERTGDLSDPGGTLNDYNDEDSDQVTVPDLALSKLLLGDGNAVIGETFQYRVTITLIEGTMENVTLVDELDPGLAFVRQDSFSRDPGISISGLTTPIVLNQGRDLVWFLGTVTNPPGPAPNTVTITYTVCITNEQYSYNGAQLNNLAFLLYGGGGPLAASASDTEVYEPDLRVEKEFNPQSGLIGETLTVTLSVYHTADSTATAHDVELRDIIPPAFDWENNIQYLSGPAFTADTGALPAVSVFWPEIPLFWVQTNPARLSFDVSFNSSGSGGDIVWNTTGVEWTSLSGNPGRISIWNNLAYERTGDETDPGGTLNDYHDEDAAPAWLLGTPPPSPTATLTPAPTPSSTPTPSMTPTPTATIPTPIPTPTLLPGVKWSQLPDMQFGYDVNSFRWEIPGEEQGVRVADDFLCTDGSNITHIRWWGSYPGYSEDTDAPVSPPGCPNRSFQVNWYEYTHPGSFSRPGTILASSSCEVYRETWLGTVPAWGEETSGCWFQYTDQWEHEFQYESCLPCPFSQTAGYYYFVSIEAVYNNLCGSNYWGWKTNLDHWNDDAAEKWTTDGLQWSDWSELTYRCGGHPRSGQTLDMAFELLSGPCFTPTPS